ncbi:MAG: hypothetical protein ACLTXI_13655, partial [Collinsella sp.]
GYRGRPDNNRGRMPQGSGRGGFTRGRGGVRAPQNNGLDPRIVYAGIGAVALLLIVLIVVLLRGCGSSTPESTPETPVATKTTTKKSSKKTVTADEDEDADEGTDESTDSETAKKTTKKGENEVTKVKVSVAKGKTAWIEVKVDGKSVLCARRPAPLSRNTPESSIEITTSKPSDVTVTKNGEKVRYIRHRRGSCDHYRSQKETTDARTARVRRHRWHRKHRRNRWYDGTDASPRMARCCHRRSTTTDSADYSYDSY